eukprot:6551911-Alexandrium_andersonii.AAC.1
MPGRPGQRKHSSHPLKQAKSAGFDTSSAIASTMPMQLRHATPTDNPLVCALASTKDPHRQLHMPGQAATTQTR